MILNKRIFFSSGDIVCCEVGVYTILYENSFPFVTGVDEVPEPIRGSIVFRSNPSEEFTPTRTNDEEERSINLITKDIKDRRFSLVSEELLEEYNRANTI